MTRGIISLTFVVLLLLSTLSYGFVVISNSPDTTVGFNPEIVHVERPGMTFMVDIVVTNVTNMIDFVVTIGWDPKIVEVTTGDPNGWRDPLTGIRYNIYEGPFFKDFTNTTTFIINRVNNQKGAIERLYIASYAVPASGSGVVARINFTSLSFGITTLDIEDSFLTSIDPHGSIPHTIVNCKVAVISICVDDDNISGPWNGSLQHPYQNITSALQNALANDSIFVRTGTYQENLIIDKSVLLIGENRTNTIVDGGETAHTIILTASNVTIRAFTIQSNGASLNDGIFLLASNNTAIENNTLAANAWGIQLQNSNCNTVKNNYIAESAGGVKLCNSHNNIIEENLIINNNYGVYLTNSNENIVINNNLQSTSHDGITILSSNNNRITSDLVNGSGRYGIHIAESSGNMVTESCLTQNDNGIYVNRSENNFVCHNVFVNNTKQALCEDEAITNWWDDAYPSGGNFWSDYVGTDVYSGQNQNESGCDGIGDSPYIINEGAVDRYPLIVPFTSLSLTWNKTSYRIGFVTNSTISSLRYDGHENILSFYVTGPTETAGFCWIAIPKSLVGFLPVEGLTIRIGESPPLSTITIQDEQYIYAYFNYKHSTHKVVVKIATENAIIIRLLPSKTIVKEGETFLLHVIIENVAADPGVVGVQFEIVWNSTLLEALDMTEILFHSITPPDEQDNIWRLQHSVSEGYVGYAYLWYSHPRAIENGYAPISGNQTVATITFESKEAGLASLIFSTVMLSGPDAEHVVRFIVHPFMTPLGNFYLAESTVKIQERLLGDLNSDNLVDVDDAIIAANAFGSYPGHLRWNSLADENGDKYVDILDIIVISKNFGKMYP